jgi:cobalt/nickel transport system permease protein
VRNLFARLDPRARILAVVGATVIIASTPRAVLSPFAYYLPLVVILVLSSRASVLYLVWRCLAASPFILLAAGLLAMQSGFTPQGLPAAEGVNAALSVAFKGYMAALLLAFLTATTALSELLWALRRMKAPESLNLILGMMYRYTSLLSEEYARMERARDSRTVRPLGRQRFAIYGRQLGTLIIRSWDRAEHVHAAMVSRGFNGSWPSRIERDFGWFETAFVLSTALLFLIPRLTA